jgi:GntR family transcriptional regulator
VADSKYREIAEDLRKDIESGVLAAEERLPPEPELERRYGASRNTVRDAVKLLTQRGLVSTQRGRGTFVNKKIEPYVITLTQDPLSRDPETGFGGGEGEAYLKEVRARNREPRADRPEISIKKASSLVAKALEIEESSRVVLRHQKRFIDEKPWSLQTSYYPMSFVNEGAEQLLDDEDIPGGAVAYLGEKLGITQVGYQDKIRVRPPDEIELTFFAIPDDGGVSVFEIHRVAYDANQTPYRLTVSVFPADRNAFVINVNDVPDKVVREPWVVSEDA